MTAAPRVVGYDRETLLNTLVYHWPTSTAGCTCGWAVLGESFPEHVADVYEASLCPVPCLHCGEALQSKAWPSGGHRWVHVWSNAVCCVQRDTYRTWTYEGKIATATPPADTPQEALDLLVKEP